MMLSPKAWLVIAIVAGVALYTGLAYYAGGIGPRGALALAKSERAAEIEANRARLAADAEARNLIGEKREAEHETRAADLRAQLERARAGVRNGQGSGGAPALSSAASVVACPDRSADAARRLERLEAGVLELLGRGNAAIERTITCKAWLDDQVKRGRQNSDPPVVGN